MSQLAGRTVLVTGSEGAFGTGLVAALERMGARVAGLDRAEPTREGTFRCDITDDEAVRLATAAALDYLGGRLDVLVNNAGIGTASPMSDPCGPVERHVFDVNIIGTWNVTAATLPWLLASKGHVVNVASLLAVVTFPYVGAYSASKRGVVALSDTLRAEHGRNGLSVTTMYPGYVNTAIHTPGEERSGLTLHGLAPLETLEQVVDAYVRSIVEQPRDISTSRKGNLILRFARAAPTLTELLLRVHLRLHGGLKRPASWTIERPPAPTPAGSSARDGDAT